MSELIGKVVCGYRITGQIGEGGMGKVYLAESAFLKEYKQQVAIKTLTARTDNERLAALMRDLFEREANIHVQFKHPNIVSVIQYAVDGDELFLLLEYVPGYEYKGRHIGNVAELIRYETGPIPHLRALKLFVQALDAISYAHNFRYRWEGKDRIGLVHRDIKPANLLLADSQTIKVTDFGIVKVRHAEGVTSATGKLTPGTSGYMSPEAILGPDHFGLEELDGRSDIYALGVVLFEMLAGRMPFAPDPGKNVDMSLRVKHVEQPPPPPSSFYPGIPQELDGIVLRALEKNPEKRYQTAAEFRQAILEFVGEPELLAAAAPSAGLSANLNGVAKAPETTPLDVQKTTPPAFPAPRSIGGEAIGEPAGKTSSAVFVTIVAVLLAVAAAVYFLVLRKAEPVAQTNNKPTPTATATPLPLPEGVALIPGGSFLMGRNLTEDQKKLRVPDNRGTPAEVFSYSYPAHEMKVGDFYLDVTEVSNREYARFVSEKKYPAPEGWTGGKPPEGAEDNPVVNVTYHDAFEFCRWRTAARKDGLVYRLPTEEEWEYAARGKDAGRANGKINLYPWGEDWKPGLANTDEARLKHTQIVTANRNGASPFGILNLCGNVAEWTATDFSHYPGSDRETPREPGYSGTYQVVRGGSFDFKKEWATTITRAWARPTVKGPNLGFRCAADAKR